MALNTSIRTVTCYLQSGVCWHRLVDVNIWMTSAHTQTYTQIHRHTCMHIVVGQMHTRSGFGSKLKKKCHFWGIYRCVTYAQREMLFPVHGSNQAQTYNHGDFHASTHTHHSTQALSISALTIGSLCWAGWDVRMNQCEDSWLDMPIHLPKKRERKRVRESKRNELSPGATCLAICITLQFLQRAFECLWDESRRGKRDTYKEGTCMRRRKKRTGDFKIFLYSGKCINQIY